MKLIRFLTIILLSSCGNKNETIINRQQDIKKEMERIKAVYFIKSDSLENIKAADPNSAKHLEIADELVLAEREKNHALLKLQKEYDSLELEVKKKL